MPAPELGFDLSINLGNVLTMGAAIIAIVWKAGSFERRLDTADALKEQEAEARKEEEVARTRELTEIKNAISELKSVVTVVAVQKNELDNLRTGTTEDRRATNERIVRMEKMLDELRHGRGLVQG